MTELAHLARNVTYRVELPGGQRRLKEAALYVMRKAEHFDFFGLVKLNKILWRADFKSFRDRHYPITGRLYQRLPNGPAPVEMLPLLNEMQSAREISFRATDVPNERRPIANVDPITREFSPVDLEYLDGAIEYYRNMTATQTSEDSHGVAWRTHDDTDLLPYESSIFSDSEMPQELEQKLKWMARERRWRSQ